MGLLARISNYLAPLNHSAREHRAANRIYARELIQAERDYWRGRIMKAVTRAELDEARRELDHLDTLEAQANG